MSLIGARVLDRLNVAVVRARVGSRQPRPDSMALASYAERLPADPFVSAASPKLQPTQGDDTRVQLWREPGSGWTATRLLPRGGGSPRASLVFLHGWLATRAHVAAMRIASAPLLKAGIEVWIPRLPGHMERTPAGAVSGERCLSADLVATSESVRHAVAETQALGAWLRRQGRSRVGLWGISLGGWVASLAVTVAGDWDAAALWTPVVDPLVTLWESPLASTLRAALQHGGIERETVADLFDRFAPLQRDLQTAPERVRVIGARYDNVVGAASLAVLAQRWGVRVDWFGEGHISILLSQRARRRCRTFLLDRL